MSHWINIEKKDIEISTDDEDIDIWYKRDYNGNCYISVKVKDIIDILKENNLFDNIK